MFTFARLRSPRPTQVFHTLWRFAAERQEIMFRRLRGDSEPWTCDPILERYRFTNAYRVLDRVSQYLVRHVIYCGSQAPDEVFFRILLFKFFNRIDTWELLLRNFGEITWRDYRFSAFDRVLTAAIDAGDRIFSAAYIMPSGKSSFGSARKHRNCLRLLERMMTDDVPHHMASCRAMGDAFSQIRAYPMIGDFLAYQFVTDLNYSTFLSFSEMEFVAPGPGAAAGLRKCFVELGDLSPSDTIRWMTETQNEHFSALGLHFRSLAGRPLQLIDCQNLLCEVDKYSRVKHPEFNQTGERHRIKQTFRPNTSRLEYWFPPKWNLMRPDSKDSSWAGGEGQK
jgi:hypothetical protein